MRASRRHAEWERRAVVHLFRKVAAERKRGEAITQARLVELAEDLHRVLFYSAGRFRHQIGRIAARIVREVGAPPLPVHVRPSKTMDKAVDMAWTEAMPEALANPFLTAPEVKTVRNRASHGCNRLPSASTATKSGRLDPASALSKSARSKTSGWTGKGT